MKLRERRLFGEKAAVRPRVRLLLYEQLPEILVGAESDCYIVCSNFEDEKVGYGKARGGRNRGQRNGGVNVRWWFWVAVSKPLAHLS